MDNLLLEKDVLLQKRRKILDEIDEKIKTQEEISRKLRILTKEARGSYSEEKENFERVYNILKKNIESHEESIKLPYFGRVDFCEKFGEDEKLYIGKQSISSTKDGEEIIIDWRAPIADLYYSGTGGEAYYKAPLGVIEGDLSLKRKFLFKDDEIEKIFDESTNEIIINNEEGENLVDEFLKINLEQSRGKKLKEVVATIQKEQNKIIRWPKNLPIIVQGSAGSGKTTIALHRLAYLLYRYRETLNGKDILVLAPNKLFLEYISEILPNLGTDDVSQTTFQDLVLKILKLKLKVKTKDEKLKNIIEDKNEKNVNLMLNSSKFKGSLLFKKIIERYVSLLESSSIDIKSIEIEEYTIFAKKEIMRLYLKDLKSYPINKRKDEIKRYLNLKLKDRIEVLMIQIDRDWESKINNVKKQVCDENERRKLLVIEYDERNRIKTLIKSTAKKVMNEYFKAWRGITSNDIYANMFKNKAVLEIAVDGKIPTELLDFIGDEVLYNYENNIIDEDDLGSLLYIQILLEGIDKKLMFKHIVVDEAQDYSPFQIYLINNLVYGNSITLVGDLAQGIYFYKGIKSWDNIINDVFSNKATFITLSQSYRSTIEIIEFANKTLESQNLGIKSAKPVLRHGDKPEVFFCENTKVSVNKILEIIDIIKQKDKKSIAIITKTFEEAKELEKNIKKYSKNKFQLIKPNENKGMQDIIIIPSYITKGLEFDATIIYNPLEDNYKDNLLDKRLLYVALTRALHCQFIITEGVLNRNIEK